MENQIKARVIKGIIAVAGTLISLLGIVLLLILSHKAIVRILFLPVMVIYFIANIGLCLSARWGRKLMLYCAWMALGSLYYILPYFLRRRPIEYQNLNFADRAFYEICIRLTGYDTIDKTFYFVQPHVIFGYILIVLFIVTYYFLNLSKLAQTS